MNEQTVNKLRVNETKKIQIGPVDGPDGPQTVEFWIGPPSGDATVGTVTYVLYRYVRRHQDGAMRGFAETATGQRSIVQSGVAATHKNVADAKAMSNPCYREIEVSGGFDEIEITNGTDVTVSPVRVRVTQRATPVRSHNP